MSTGLPLPVRPGQAFRHEGAKLVYHGRVADRLHITDEVGSIFLTYDKLLDSERMPDEFWFWQEYLQGSISLSASGERRRDRIERLDIAAAIVRDPVSLKRFTWARLARAAGLRKSHTRVQKWIDATPCPPVPPVTFCTKDKLHHQGITGKLQSSFATKPKARILIEWMALLEAGSGIGAFVSKAGRPLGHSQLPPKVDLLVERVTELYWENPSDFPSIEDAACVALRWWEMLAERGETEIGAEPPTYETVRRRIRKSEIFDNYVKRYGLHAARAKFAPKGEPIPVTRPFERIYMDGVEFEHYTHYSHEWKEIAGKMKGIAAMDAYSLFRWPYALFHGPFRSEMTVEALMHVFAPKSLTAEDIEADPTSLIHGVPTTIVFDNDKAILPPSIVPHLMLLGEIELLAVYHPNGKSPLEGSFKHDKQRLAEIKGRVLPPRRNKDPRYDPAKETDLTKAQYAVRVEQARRDWNRTPKTSLSDRSPNEVMLEFLRTSGVQSYYGHR